MSMRALFVGDVIGSPGREAVRRHLPVVKERYGIDVVILNAENIAAGFGVTLKTLAEMSNAGVDIFTSGNHIWDKNEAAEAMKKYPLIRPLNYPAELPALTVKANVGAQKKSIENKRDIMKMITVKGMGC